MRATTTLLLLATVATFSASACAPPQAPPQPPPAPASGSAFVDANPPKEEAPDPASDPEPSEAPALPWWTPVSPISRDDLTQADKTVVAGCIDPQRLQAEDVTSEELFEAAQCLGSHRAFGQEIRIYMYLLTTHPDGPHTAEALVALGHRYEQLDVRSKAVDSYRMLLSKYPAREDARTLGKRAVCLARSLGDQEAARKLLADLERKYGRKGFVVPPDSAFDQLCGDLRPVV